MQKLTWRQVNRFGAHSLKCCGRWVCGGCTVVRAPTQVMPSVLGALRSATQAGLFFSHLFTHWCERLWLNARESRQASLKAQTQLMAVQLACEAAYALAKTGREDVVFDAAVPESSPQPEQALRVLGSNACGVLAQVSDECKSVLR